MAFAEWVCVGGAGSKHCGFAGCRRIMKSMKMIPH